MRVKKGWYLPAFFIAGKKDTIELTKSLYFSHNKMMLVLSFF